MTCTGKEALAQLTYITLFILSNMYVFTGSLHFQQVPEDLFVNLDVGNSNGEVDEVILVQQFKDLGHCSGNYSLFVVARCGCGQKTNSRLMNNSERQNAQKQDLRWQG